MGWAVGRQGRCGCVLTVSTVAEVIVSGRRCRETYRRLETSMTLGSGSPEERKAPVVVVVVPAIGAIQAALPVEGRVVDEHVRHSVLAAVEEGDGLLVPGLDLQCLSHPRVLQGLQLRVALAAREVARRHHHDPRGAEIGGGFTVA